MAVIGVPDEKYGEELCAWIRMKDGATPLTAFRRVMLPLMAPGIANAFLIVFIESLADFGNPIVLAGNFEVLSTKIFFAIAGAQHDPAMVPLDSLVITAARWPASSRRPGDRA